MNSVPLFRLAGFGLAISGIIAGAGDATYNLLGPQAGAPVAPFVAGVTFVANIGVLLCLPGIGIRLAERSGVLGVIGYVLLSVGLAVFGVASYMINAVVSPNLPPELEQQPPVGLITIWMTTELLALVGLIVLGLATLRARAFARWIPWALFGSALLVALSDAPIPGVQLVGAAHAILLYAGLVAMAVSLIRGTAQVHAPAGQPALATA